MVDFQRLLDQAAAPIAPNAPSSNGVDASPVLDNPFLRKEQSVALAALEKKTALAPEQPVPDYYQIAAGMGNQSGAQSMDPVEQDLRTMQPLDLYLKYGSSAFDMLNNLSSGGTEFFQDTLRRNDRSTGETIFDSSTGAAAGLVGGLGGLVALGTGLVDEDAGTWLGSKVQQGMNWVEEQQSEKIAAARRVQRTLSGLDARDNALQRQQEIAAGDSELVADLRRWGRDTVDTLANSVQDPTMLGQGVSEAVGSLLAGGPVAKGLRALGGAAMRTAGRAGLPATGALATRAAAVGERAVWPVATAGLEAGGTYSGSVSEVMGMSFEQLEANSPMYRELLASGLSPEDARIEVANRTGLFSAAIQAPIAAAAGTLTRFAETPFRVPSLGSAARNVLVNEPLEEAIQSTAGGVSQNFAIQQNADQSRALSEGVGEQTATGALFGLGAAGAVQGPGAVGRATAKGVTEGAKLVYRGTRAAVQPLIEAGRPLFSTLLEKGAERRRNLEKASPVADEAIQQQAAVNASTAVEDVQTISNEIQNSSLEDEQKAESEAYVASMMQAMVFDPESLDYAAIPDDHKAMLEGSSSRPEAIHRMAREVARLEEGQEQLRAASSLYQLLEPYFNMDDRAATALDSLAMQNPTVKGILDQYDQVLGNISSTPSVQRALRAINELTAKDQFAGNIKPVTEESINTPEGQQNINNALAVARLHPDRGNLEAAEQILAHASTGRIPLTPQQQKTLRSSMLLLRARRKMEEAINASGLKTAKDVVSEQVVAGNDPLRKIAKSAMQHTQGVLSAVGAGNTEEAGARLWDFGLFVQHMQNKVEALNTSFSQNGTRVPYNQLQPNFERNFKMTTAEGGEYVNVKSPKSVEHAQAVALEAQLLSDVYNGLVDTFPELQQSQVQAVQLNSQLIGKPDEVVSRFRNPTLQQQQQQEPANVQEVNTPAPEPTGTPEGEAVELPAATETQSEEEGPRTELNQEEEIPEAPEAPDGMDRPIRNGTVRLVESEIGPVRSIKAFVDGQEVGELLYSMDGSLEQSVEVQEGFQRRGIARAMYALARERGAVLDNARNQSEEGQAFRQALDQEQVQEQEPQPTSIEGAFPNLFKGVRNLFLESFTFPREPKTRLYAEESPAASVRRALSSNLRLQSFLLGSNVRNTLDNEVADAYQNLLSDSTEGNTLGHLLSIVSDNLQTFLKTKGKKFGDPGVEANRWRNGKVLNLTEQVSGGFQYNQQLLEEAGLATMQWLLSSNQYQSNMDEQDVSDLTGIPVVELTPEIIERVTQGMSLEQAVQTLGLKISNYWGLNPKNDADIAYTQGIPQAMASEMLRALREMGLLSVETTEIREEDFSVDQPRTINRYIPSSVRSGDPLHAFQDAIETAVMVEPEHTNYFNEEVPPVAQRQMNNPEVENTPAQKDALEKEQQTPFYINRPIVSLFSSLGPENLLRLFGTVVPEGSEDDWNINHLKSVEGQNTSIVAAFQHMLTVVADLDNTAQTLNRSIDDVAVRYAYNMSRVGRMQMLGKYSPQASKLMREAFLPTRSTLDLSSRNGEAWDAYSLGLAQAFGIKVHNLPLEQSQAKLDAMLNGGLAESVQMLREWLNQANLDNPLEADVPLSTGQVEQLSAGFKASGADLTMASLHALVDYARLLNTADPSRFTTSVYLEADGVTNGPINAMALMTVGEFTPSWVSNIRKGGLTFGPTRTMADIRTSGEDGDSKDLYQASTDATFQALSNLRQQLGSQKKGADQAVRQMDQLLSMMDLFSLDVTFDPNKEWSDGALEMSRGIAKNPLTITVYGSGAAGIAGKLVSQLTTAVYARMSDVIKVKKDNKNITLAEAMFPNDPDAQVKMDRFQEAYDALTQNTPVRVKGELLFEPAAERNFRFDPRTFTFNTEALQAMEANMLELFVKPMREGIQDTVGAPLMEAVGLLRDAAQIQSIVLENQFGKKIEEKLADREANDPTWRRGDFLSESDLRQIHRDLRKVSPLVQTGEQTFMIASSQRLEARGNDLQISAALDDTMRGSPSLYAPGQAGVRAIPMMTIGMGDGMMMQLLAQLGLQGTFKIFDGMNMPLDKITDYSRAANEAVYESWKGNPLREMLKSFDRFIENFDQAWIEDVAEDLVRVLYDFSDRPTEDTLDYSDIYNRMLQMRNNLQWAADSIDARHQTIQSLPTSVDQMAAAAAPYHNGRRGLENASEEDVLKALNDRYQQIMSGKALETEEVSVAPVQHVAPAKPTPEIENVGRVHSTGARVLSWTAMTNLARGKAMTEAQKLIFGEIRRSLSARNYKVITGTVEQLDAYIEQKGLTPRPDQEVFGWTNIQDKTIYMINPSMETMVHELVHAASYETVLAHYQGETTPEVTEAIQRLETMMEEFLAMEGEAMDPVFRAAYTSAREAILSSNLEPNQAVSQAKALNEFMAWAMTNEQLTRTLKQKPAPRLVQLAKNVIKAIKNLVWGRKLAPKPVDDFLSNLQFNSGIIIRSQPSLSMVARDGELFHSASFGTSDRLKAVRHAFNKKVTDYLGPMATREKGRTLKTSDAQIGASRVAMSMNAHGFRMTMQESSTFRNIVAALATEAEIDPNALARAQELYAHVAKVLKVEHFMSDPESLDPAMRYYAQEKYDSVMGRHFTHKDALGRTSLLPAFLGLAVVSDEFRSVLSRLELPARTRNQEGTLDAWLENTSNTIMDSLSRRLAGDPSSKSVLEAVDNLVERIRQTSQNEQTFLDQYSGKAGGIVDRANDIVTTGLEKLSDIAMEKADDVLKNSKSTINRGLANFSRLLASAVSEKNGAIVAEQTMMMLNKSNVWEPVHKLMSDLIGRTSSNAVVYDLIKVTRSMVQQLRQQFREELPRIISSKFNAKITDAQWGTMFRAMGKTDLAVLRDSLTNSEIHNLFVDQTALDNEINAAEQLIQANDPKHWNLIQKKSRQLAQYMNKGMPGANLLRNAEAVAGLYGETVARGYALPPANIVKAIDKLITLYAVEGLSQEDRTSMASLVPGEAEGLSFVLDYLVGQRKEEVSKAVSNLARINSYKGFIPSEQEQGVSLITADDSQFSELRERGYVRVANYTGSTIIPNKRSRGYYYAPLSGRAVFNQGIMQNVRHTSGGVDAVSGLTISNMAGRITDRHTVRRYVPFLRAEGNTLEGLMPVYNQYGQVVALEQPMSAIQLERIKPSQHLPRMIGIWRGRQAEEGMSQIYNEKLIDALKAMYDGDMKASSSNQKQYVNLLDKKSLNAIQADATNLFTEQTLDYIRDKFGEQFWVRKDMLDDAIGYRSASVGDFWTGNTRWSKNTQETVKNLVAAFSLDGYRYLVKSEQVIQNFMADARTLIVVKSIIVPTFNFMANIYQLIGRGVPLLSIVRGMPRKLGEIDSYTKSRLRQIDAEAELRATEDPIQQRKLKAELRSISDAHKRLSIWPLIEAGEFSTIADVGMTHEDLELTSGKIAQYMENLVNKLPESVRNAGRYALVTRDTALFQGLQKSVQYGDFIAKAVLYDDLTKRQKKSQVDALGRITEEFVNYDRLPGRFRSYLENMGLLWFYNYKIRITKVALSMIRNNPVHALIAGVAPVPFTEVDLPVTDNLVTKMFDGSLGFSVGPEMGLESPFLNPWLNLVN